MHREGRYNTEKEKDFEQEVFQVPKKEYQNDTLHREWHLLLKMDKLIFVNIMIKCSSNFFVKVYYDVVSFAENNLFWRPQNP